MKKILILLLTLALVLQTTNVAYAVETTLTASGFDRYDDLSLDMYALHEENLDGAILHFNVSGDTFVDEIIDTSKVTLSSVATTYEDLMTVDEVKVTTNGAVTLSLKVSLTSRLSLDSDISDLLVTVDGSEMTSGNPIISSPITVKRAVPILANDFVAYYGDPDLVAPSSSIEASTGNLEDPWMEFEGDWYKLTHSNSEAFENAFTFDGLGGTVADNELLSDFSVDSRAYVPVNEAQGYGSVVATGTYGTSEGAYYLTFEKTYTLDQYSSSVSISTKVTNNTKDGRAIDNFEYWYGTGDDYIGLDDNPVKTRGNMVDGLFVPVTTGTENAKAVMIESDTGSAAVQTIFYTEDESADTVIVSGYKGNSLSKVVAGTPSQVVSLTGDGGYALYYKVATINGGSSFVFNGGYVAEESAPPVTVPASPTALVAEAGDGQANVTFTPPTDNGGAPITEYKVTASPGGLWQTTTTTSATIKGLSNGQEYTFTAVATNSQGDSQASTSSNAVTPSTVPNPPEKVVAVAGNGQANVSFIAPADNGGAPITGYTVTSNPGGITRTTLATEVALTGLTNGTEYTFTVVAANVNGNSQASETSSSVTPATVAGAPTEVEAVSGDQQATISFKEPDNGGAVITSYKVISSPENIEVSVTSSPATVTGLTNGETYTFTVVALNSKGESLVSLASNEVNYTSVPDAPINVQAVAGRERATVTFEMTQNTSGVPITGYRVISSPSSYEQLVTTTSALMYGLSADTDYTFTVKAINSVGESDPSLPSNVVRPREKATTSVTESEPEKVIILVNEEEVSAGTESVTSLEDQTQVEITIDSAIIDAKILAGASNKEANKIQVKVATKDADQVVAKLTGDLVETMEDHDFTLALKADDVEYTIPAKELTIKSVAQQLGVNPDDMISIEVDITIEQVDATIAQAISHEAQALGTDIVFAPVSFKIEATTRDASGKTTFVEIDTFSTYVERIMAIPEEVDPTMVTTGIIVNTDGTFSHIPTEVYELDGLWYARINSRTNSSYALIWHPITVTSVSNHWGMVAVNNLASRLIIDNVDNFEPDAAMTRADVASYLVKALGLYRTGVAEVTTYSDVDEEDMDALVAASKYGIVAGYLDGTFKPDRLISREEAMVMYSRAMKVAGLETLNLDAITDYKDYNDFSSWAREGAAQAVGAGLFKGKGNKSLEPLSTLTHAEAARATENLLKLSGLID